MARFARAGLKPWVLMGVAALVLGVVASPIASAQQSVNFSIGGFTPHGEDSRASGDVLVNNLDFLAFNIKDFNTAVVSGEYLVGLGNFLEGSLGVGYHRRTVPTVYLDFVNSNGSEIDQDLKLSVVPFTATVRFLPLGHRVGVTPYIGGGVGILRWHYSETGQFLATDNTIFQGEFKGDGTATGPVILGGVRVPVGNWGVGGEIRYQSATGDLPIDQGFSGTTIDLGGFTYSFTVNFRF
jgi:hypothetical protein